MDIENFKNCKSNAIDEINFGDIKTIDRMEKPAIYQNLGIMINFNGIKIKIKILIWNLVTVL